MDKLNVKVMPTQKGVLYFSRCPYASEDIEELKKLNLDCIFNLAKELSFISEIEKTICKNVVLGNIEDFSIPDDMNSFYLKIKEIVELLNDDKKVLIHCMAGRGRTSMAICCTLIAMNANNIDDIFKSVHFVAHGPERKCQCDFVREFEKFSKSKQIGQ